MGLTTERTLEPMPHPIESQLELSIVMPCLNEAETIAACVNKALRFLERERIAGEIVVADNGSNDGSRNIARQLGARIVDVPTRGYGAALMAGISAARGRFVIMGDADDSYDFNALMPFLRNLRKGADLVMGNRFKGRIERGAMPPLHQYLGNSVLSFIGRLFFNIDLGDFHCGLRGFSREAILRLKLRTTGMEFASEMVVRAALAGMKLAEVPTTLSKDGRSRQPHLRTWRDGWRHLRFLLLYSPRWLFLYPGLAMILIGAVTSAILLFGPVKVGGFGLDIRTMLVACASCIVGVQSVCFAIIARSYATARQLLPPSPHYQRLLEYFTLEYAVAIGGCLLLLGLAGLIGAVIAWGEVGFGDLDHSQLLRLVTISVTAIGVGVQLIHCGFLAGLLAIDYSD
jgi:glycosyltransferase involved in cell wall biosynthesis